MKHSEKIFILTKAIKDKNAVVITYKAEEKSRVVNPHCVYNSIGKGESKVTLDAYQTSGNTNSQNEAFKMFHVEEIKSVSMLDTKFKINSQFNGESPRYLDSFRDMKIA